jgi:ubiquinone/menaquinone biosynthesis C-methylase UbiE
MQNLPSRILRRTRRLLTGSAKPAPKPAGPRKASTTALRHWEGSAEVLDRYLVSGYQNPRLNIQSILLRHVFLTELLGSDASAAMEDEIRYAVELNETLRLRAEELGVTMGTFRDPEKLAAVERVSEAVAGKDEVFTDRWREALRDVPAGQISVIEFACGSADDYRAFADSGLGRPLAYTGIDVNEHNVENARRRHPDAHFEVGDILALPYEDRSFDDVIAADIFEHLPPDGFRRALDEACRLSRRGLVFTFFNMDDVPEHDIRPLKAYHRNLMSRRQIEEHIRALGFGEILSIPVAPWLAERYGDAHSYNPFAWTMIAEREADVIPRYPHRLG